MLRILNFLIFYIPSDPIFKLFNFSIFGGAQLYVVIFTETQKRNKEINVTTTEVIQKLCKNKTGFYSINFYNHLMNFHLIFQNIFIRSRLNPECATAICNLPSNMSHKLFPPIKPPSNYLHHVNCPERIANYVS